MLRVIMRGKQMCSAGVDKVLRENKAKHHPLGRGEERGRWSLEQLPLFIRNLVVKPSRPSLWPLAA